MCCKVYFLDRSETQKKHRRISSAVSREVVATYDNVQEWEECRGGGQRSCMLAAAFQGKNAQKHHN